MSDNHHTLTGFGSLAVHAGFQSSGHQSHLTPIHASSTYLFDSAEQGMRIFNKEEEGYVYSRWGNPSFTEAEEKIAALEGFGIEENGKPIQLKAILHASGMGALTTILLSLLNSGDKILSHFSLYGGTHEMMEKILPGLSIGNIMMDLSHIESAAQALQQDKSIKMLYLETPANPTLRCVDLEALTQLAHRYQIPVVVDNTFATPYLQQPFRFGVDYVLHSTTKFLNGHGTAIGGVLLGKDFSKMNGSVLKYHRLLGANSNPFDAFLLTQGMKTLELRMDRHCENASQIAMNLENHPAVDKVFYPGLSAHPDYALVKKQMRHAGPVMSFELKGGIEAGKAFLNKLKMCKIAVSLGTCDTLISHPASMTHIGVPKAEREKYGITDGLIRMSVGIENIEDLWKDLNQALG